MSEQARLTVAGRTLLVLFFCAGIAFLGLLAGGEHRAASARGGGDPMAGYFSPGMPRYPGAEEIPSGRENRVGGSRVKLAFFSTEDEPDKVSRFYASAWRTRRFFVREDVTHRGGVVSAVDAEQRLVFQVLLQVQGRRTLAFPSETVLPQAGATDAPPPVPLFPESRVVLTLGSREGPNDARIHLSTNEGGLDQNLVHYRREAEARGFRLEAKPGEGSVEPGHRVLLFRSEGGELTINLSLISGKSVRVHMMEVGQ